MQEQSTPDTPVLPVVSIVGSSETSGPKDVVKSLRAWIASASFKIRRRREIAEKLRALKRAEMMIFCSTSGVPSSQPASDKRTWQSFLRWSRQDH